MRSVAVPNSEPLLQKLRLPESGARILVAVSGGVDSMVLLHLLKKLSTEHRWKLTVAHFNHCLRGRASDGDEAFVGKEAAAMRLPFVSERGDVKKFAKTSRFSIEMAARKLRHQFFARIAREKKIKIVALAHHADDQVELFFLRLLRGSGGDGLTGMKWRSPSPVDSGISLVRPLLDCSKAELEVFAQKNKVGYREDATNSSADFLRNRVRNELLPLLRKNYQPALNKTVLRLMEIVGAESAFVNETTQSWLKNRRSDFEKLPVAIQRHVLKWQLERLNIAPDFELIESLLSAANKFITVVANLSVSRDKKGTINIREHHVHAFERDQLSVKARKLGGATFDGMRLQWQVSAVRDRFARIARRPGREFFDAEKIGEKVILRHWRAGDRFQPIGFKSAVKLQDFFTNQKIPRNERHKLTVAEAKGEIFWVEGLRISENFKLTPQTKRVLAWNWRR
jgi:tRNA(Ile)-lysidine synthase